MSRGFAEPDLREEWTALREEHGYDGYLAVGVSGKIWGCGKTIKDMRAEVDRVMDEAQTNERVYAFRLSNASPVVDRSVGPGYVFGPSASAPGLLVPVVRYE